MWIGKLWQECWRDHPSKEVGWSNGPNYVVFHASQVKLGRVYPVVVAVFWWVINTPLTRIPQVIITNLLCCAPFPNLIALRYFAVIAGQFCHKCETVNKMATHDDGCCQYDDTHNLEGSKTTGLNYCLIKCPCKMIYVDLDADIATVLLTIHKWNLIILEYLIHHLIFCMV